MLASVSDHFYNDSVQRKGRPERDREPVPIGRSEQTLPVGRALRVGRRSHGKKEKGFSCRRCNMCKGQRQEGTQHVQEAAEAGAQSGQTEGEEVAHEHPPPTPSGTRCRGAGGAAAGGRDPPPFGSGPELTAEGGAGPWNLTAADGSAGDAAVQQGIPVPLLWAWLHGHPSAGPVELRGGSVWAAGTQLASGPRFCSVSRRGTRQDWLNPAAILQAGGSPSPQGLSSLVCEKPSWGLLPGIRLCPA